ncbi:glycoside hydrolase family 127 protein [Actinoplanes sichuanensis]|uniref:Glycoside hydrolase family 127 protein n=1 Tax=Actinoplanes sichuanensis TaxID=512349 RepID=A0ABW4A7Y0_9ACTN|nr:beta-L-arabinofuranosidase domain-containing protein [Actinoplanes sichuanensis]
MTIDETLATAVSGMPVAPTRGRLRPLGVGEVTLRSGFWQRRQDTNSAHTLAHIERWLEKAGWLANFELVDVGDRRGREFADTEVYKYLEALAWEYGRTRDPEIDNRYRAIVRRVVAAQEPDGYLNTLYGRPGQAPRYSDLEWGHELYSFGYLIQAAVARARTYGPDELLEAALRAADHVCAEFGPEGRNGICGHAEIELALVELYRLTGVRRYLDQARLFVERHGHGTLADIEFGRSYFQDDIAVRDADVFRGHAVRATYLAAGAVDVAVETGDAGLLDAVTRQWRNTVARRTYITGGMGSRHQDEAFGEDFVLPPDRAYSETCAGVGSVLLSWRLLLAHGDPRYADLIERTLFNVIATSPGDGGDRFFYTNTLHQRTLGAEPPADVQVPRAASNLRAPWFDVSCCPTNLARTFASLAAYIATVDDDGLQIHQYTSAVIRTSAYHVEIDTAYPEDGLVSIRIVAGPDTPWTLSLRVPAWASGATLDGLPISRGLVQLRRDFTAGQVLQLRLPVQPRLVTGDDRIDAVRGAAAVERGPVVYCLESVDVPPDVAFDALRLDPGTVPVDADGTVLVTCRPAAAADHDWPYRPATPPTDATPVRVALHPYHRWARRGPSTMRVWIPLTPER